MVLRFVVGGFDTLFSRKGGWKRDEMVDWARDASEREKETKDRIEGMRSALVSKRALCKYGVKEEER